MTPVWDPSSRNATSVIPDLIRDLLVARHILASKEMLNPVQHDTRVGPVIPKHLLRHPGPDPGSPCHKTHPRQQRDAESSSA